MVNHSQVFPVFIEVLKGTEWNLRGSGRESVEEVMNRGSTILVQVVMEKRDHNYPITRLECIHFKGL